MSGYPSGSSATASRRPAFLARLWRTRQARLTLAILIDIAIAYVLWQALTTYGVLPARFFPTADAVAERIWDLLQNSTFWLTVGCTMESWVVGLVLTGSLGTLAGVLLGSSDRAYRFVRVVVELLRPIPPIVILPIVLLVMGVTLQFTVILILQGTFWIMLLQGVYGVRGVDRVMLETGRSYGMSKMRRFLYIQLPGSLPYIVTGIRITAIFALIVAIVAELVGGAPGLGNGILKAMTAGDSTSMYALILLTGVLGVLITATFTGLEKLVLFWHPSHRTETR